MMAPVILARQSLNNDQRIIHAMGKKMDDADVKKECPSCGLGVALDARICEFCGWDFQEEDEWILQIEKLERDLVLEKQKFEPGTVGNKIESSLHTPAVVKKEQLKASAAKAKLQKEMEEVLGAPDANKPAPPPERKPAPAVAVTREPRPAPGPAPKKPIIREARPVDIPVVAVEEPEPEEPAPAPMPAATPSAPSGKVRRVRKVKGASTTAAPAAQPSKNRPVK
jgi:rubredoxin